MCRSKKHETINIDRDYSIFINFFPLFTIVKRELYIAIFEQLFTKQLTPGTVLFLYTLKYCLLISKKKSIADATLDALAFAHNVPRNAK